MRAIRDVVPIPDGVDTLTAAALLHDGPTALQLLEVTDVSNDDTVLVLGASGGLGLALVQLLRARAGRVVAVARDATKRARIATFGPDAVIDPEDPEWVRQAGEALGPAGATVILDNVGSPIGPEALPLLADGGRFSAHATHDGAFPELDPDDAPGGPRGEGLGDPSNVVVTISHTPRGPAISRTTSSGSSRPTRPARQALQRT